MFGSGCTCAPIIPDRSVLSIPCPPRGATLCRHPPHVKNARQKQADSQHNRKTQSRRNRRGGVGRAHSHRQPARERGKGSEPHPSLRPFEKRGFEVVQSENFKTRVFIPPRLPNPIQSNPMPLSTGRREEDGRSAGQRSECGPEGAGQVRRPEACGSRIVPPRPGVACGQAAGVGNRRWAQRPPGQFS